MLSFVRFFLSQRESFFLNFATSNTISNTLCHEKGVVTLLRENYGSALLEQSYSSAVSRIGIVLKDTAASLNSQYAAFGRVTEGLDLLEKDEEARAEYSKYKNK